MSLEELITKATSETNTGEDWGLIIEICEKADTSEASAREAVQILTKRVQHRNVNVVLFALTVANSLVHNCGKPLRREISSRAFVDALVRVVSGKAVHEVVRTRVLDFIQQWAEEFGRDPSLGFMVDTYNQLKSQGYQFPAPHKPDVVKTQAMLSKEKEDEELQLALALSLSAQEANRSAKTPSSQPAQQPKPIQTGPKVLFQVRALYDFPGAEEGELRLQRGEYINVYDATTFQEWWKGEVRGRIGIFPSNYVEKVEGPGSTAAAVAEASRASKDGESEVLANARKIQDFNHLLSTLDPKRDNFSENENLQQLYHDILMMRPKLVKLLETYRAKQDELSAVNDRFSRACSIYHKLMDAYLAQYRHPNVYAPQHGNSHPGYGSSYEQPQTNYGSPQPGYGYVAQPPPSQRVQAYQPY
ncbi:uncharacterized protein SPPG_01455 [Spizellomyces punctatus DAOM BR117]|uniref:Class E vacuolar protein-sorting machinery protein HSE1 n=1 Tax=Spizellomyces punctatus (strain DAOM BR117) TaxID=645134 RepID=A0A0L0HSF5_SPIPD|nr:uncharacterized protein SPPG_01455 [Spizellomyces punctatus DAOM BR117]KND04007.1 hypothetical protein SPPG_01455 [Spizellomyces punctatus DAOM BR117]|eukprot:XP_016612046.1 hypothetical protein SPPG_01455 [Spizellomyces punctatus DAOM BR117]